MVRAKAGIPIVACPCTAPFRNILKPACHVTLREQEHLDQRSASTDQGAVILVFGRPLLMRVTKR
jgi:hypothetical protein